MENEYRIKSLHNPTNQEVRQAARTLTTHTPPPQIK